jgi:hypothetical protein
LKLEASTWLNGAFHKVSGRVKVCKLVYLPAAANYLIPQLSREASGVRFGGVLRRSSCHRVGFKQLVSMQFAVSGVSQVMTFGDRFQDDG